MTPEQKELSVCSFKLDEQTKRRFSAAMRAEGSTLSERIREWISEYLGDEQMGADHPQFRLELKNQSSVRDSQ
ncbi:ribbon-helix-helix protein, CopG family [Pseudomonas fulva]|uniref:ribbon-helix-helix protein, CopG family n=1 Tax=Pseudomonas fulva TaxID=47880 RepID=UPI002DBBB34B|nr:ribbon-helix-helix protein, CopG family [Pseudomonas fulva]MEB8059260.1 ribbon-helix-helix protein, CopG family [Pseudomonas fulva]